MAGPEQSVADDGVDPLARHRAAAETLLWSPGSSPHGEEVKHLYRALGDDWLASHTMGVAPPVLSAPETAPKVLERLEHVRGLVLDAGCGPSPSVSIGLYREGNRVPVSMDIGLGTVQVARTEAAARGATILGVVGDVERLPFRDAAFDGLVCDDTIEHVPDDRKAVVELARVLTSTGRAVLATPNRHSALVLKARVTDLCRGRRRPLSAYFVSNSHLREYTWAEFRKLARGSFEIRAQVPVGWSSGRKKRWISRLLIGPGRNVSQMVVLEVGRPPPKKPLAGK